MTTPLPSSSSSSSGAIPPWPTDVSGRSRRASDNGVKQWCATVCYVDAEGKREPVCNKYCLRREKKTTPPDKRHLLEWQHRWFIRFICGTQACLRDETGNAVPVIMTREERDRRQARGEPMPDDYQYELTEPWLSGDMYTDYCKYNLKKTAIRTFSPLARQLERYAYSWQDGTQQRMLRQFGQHVLDGGAFRVAWLGLQRMIAMWRDRDR